MMSKNIHSVHKKLIRLMKSSDIALYEAKEKGRNCVVVVDTLPR